MDIKIAQQETITELVLENQKLKQERDEARKDAAQLADRLSGLELRTTEELAKLERERNEWAEMCGRYKQERDDAREQIAKLQEIAKKAIKYGEKNHSRSCDAISYGGGCDCDCGIELLREEFEKFKGAQND